MSAARGFLVTLFAFFLFGIAAASLLRNESVKTVNQLLPASNKVISAPYSDDADLELVAGASLIGMVPHALAGEYTLIIDGLVIDTTTDIELIDLRGVPGQTYKMKIKRVQNGITTIVAKR